MKEFKSIVVVTHPRTLVWETIRDGLPKLAPLLDDIENISVINRREEADGTVFLVNRWKANPKIPSLLQSVIDPSMFVWIDRAQWTASAYECKWRIETQFLPEGLKCDGVTSYEEAMGGKGTRITFAGHLSILPDKLARVPVYMESAVARGIESLVTTLIPKNFRKLSKAVGEFLDADR